MDTFFNTGLGVNGTVYAVALQQDTRILLGGAFSSFSGVTRTNITRLNFDGTVDTSINFGGGANNLVGALAVQTDNNIVLGGGSNSGWWHITAVFDKPWTNVVVVSNATNFITFSTNALRLYLNGVLVASNYTTLSPYKDLDPALSPGATIGDRSRYDWTQPFSGYLDELTLYARCLTAPEISAIARAGTAGKADASVAPAQSLAKLRVSLNGVTLDTVNGDNSQWGTHSIQFTAMQTNSVLALQSLPTKVDLAALRSISISGSPGCQAQSSEGP